MQAPVFDDFSFDPFSLQQDGLTPPELDIGGRELAQALVVEAVIVVLDEGFYPSLEVAMTFLLWSSRSKRDKNTSSSCLCFEHGRGLIT